MDMNIIDCKNIRELASCNAEFYSAIVNSLLEQLPHMVASVFASKSCLQMKLYTLTCILYCMVMKSCQPGNNGYANNIFLQEKHILRYTCNNIFVFHYPMYASLCKYKV